MAADIVGQRIRALRRKRGLTQVALAELADVPQSLISQIESGARRGSAIQLEVARAIAFALGVSLDALAGVPVDDESEREPTTTALVGD
jgi:transcriptional regulator with XRE-family HTH domain